MRYYLLILTSFLFTVAHAQEHDYNYVFFTNGPMPGDYFYSRVSFQGRSVVTNVNGRLPVTSNIFHTPGNALMLQYKNAPAGSWRAAVLYHEIRGMDHFKRSSLLSFWVYMPLNKLLQRELPDIQLMRKDSSLTPAVKLENLKYGNWQQVLIPLKSFAGNNEINPTDFVGIVFSKEGGKELSFHTLYIDDIEFTDAGNGMPVASRPLITSASQKYPMHVDITWNKPADKNIRLVKIYRSENGINYKPVGVQQPYINRYADYTGKTGMKYRYAISFLNGNYEETVRSEPLRGNTAAMTDDELLTMVQEASFRYYWENAEPVSGLAKENLHGRHNMIATGASGFGMMALIAGTERKFISRKESIERFHKILNFLEKADRFHGVYPHFLDGPSGKVEPFFGKHDNGADLVETAFMFEGLLAASQYFNAANAEEKWIRDKITAIWEQAEWDWFKQRPDSKFLYWHWSPDQAWVINHNLIGWNETMVTYLLAIASPTHPVSAGMYYSGWANQDSTGIQYRSGWGQSSDGAHYTNANTYYGIKLDVGVNNGGPLFFIHYSYMGYDPHFITDKYTNYFTNNQNIARINYRYCVKNPKGFKGYGEAAWGLTASDGPYDYSADEPVTWQDRGKITPTGAIGSFPYLPREAMAALKNYYYNYGSFLWGEFGFKDAFNPSLNWCSEIYMGLNQAPMTVMIENYRTGLLWKLFMANPDIQNGLKKLGLASAGSK
ncbi:MAG: glucoamylase family protein [Ferruginibacter sp.]